MARTLSVRGLTEGAILAALVALLALSTHYIPIMGIAAALICPIPLMLLVIRHGIRVALLAAFVAAVIGVMVAGVLMGVAILLTFAPVGIALGIGVRRKLAAPAIVFISSAVVAVSLAVNLGLMLVIFQMNPYTVMIDSMRQGQDTAVQFYQRLGVDRQQLEQSTGAMRQILELMPRLIPLLIVVGGVSTAYINFEVSRLVLRKFSHSVPALPPLTTWRLPPTLLWLLPLGFVIVGTGHGRYPMLETMGLNLTILAQMLFSLQGLAVAWALLGRYNTPAWFRWVVVALAFANPVLGVLAFILGLADAGFDLRRRWRPSSPAETR